MNRSLFFELRERDRVARGPHHYHFASPAFSSYDGNLNYVLEANVMRQDYRFRIETDPARYKSGILQVTLVNVHESDRIEIDLNRKLLPQSPQWGMVDESEAYGGSVGHRRVAVGVEGDGLRKYRYEASLSDLPLRQGENALGMRVVSRGLGVNAPHPAFQGLEVLVER